MISGKSILSYATLETILVYSVSETRKMFRQNRTPKKSNQFVGTRSHAARSNNCKAAILAANKQTAGFVCTTFNGVLPPSNIYAIHLFA